MLGGGHWPVWSGDHCQCGHGGGTVGLSHQSSTVNTVQCYTALHLHYICNTCSVFRQNQMIKHGVLEIGSDYYVKSEEIFQETVNGVCVYKVFA